jgi:hypothetical protein
MSHLSSGLLRSHYSMRDIPKSEASPFLTGSPKIPPADYHNIRLNFAVAEHARSIKLQAFNRLCQLSYLRC